MTTTTMTPVEQGWAPSAPRCSVALAGGQRALLGYACINLTLGGTVRTLRLATLRARGAAGLREIVDANMALLADVLEWNRHRGIAMFRLSSDLIPFGSHPEVDLAAVELDSATLTRIRDALPGMRLSMHPAQFTVLSTADPAVLSRSIAELDYHATLMDRLGIAGGDIVLHGGGVYGDRVATARRLVGAIALLQPGVRRRLRLENDERSWAVADLLPICEEAGVPLIVDNLHHALNGGTPLAELPWARIGATWGNRRPKMHYSEQDPTKRPGAHTVGVTPGLFEAMLAGVGLPAFDVMLECKAKEQALLALVEALRVGTPPHTPGGES